MDSKTNERNDLQEIIDKALDGMAREAGGALDPGSVNLAEFSRRTGLSRSRARTLKQKGSKAMQAKLVSYLDGAGPTAANVGYALALYTGMREGEICGLRWRDVDLDAGIIHVRNVIVHDGPTCYEKEPKTKNGRRDIPITNDLARTIQFRLSDAEKKYKEVGIELKPNMYVVGTVADGAGKWMNPHRLWQDWKAVAKSLGLKGTQDKVPTFHGLRHTYATVAAHIPGTDLKSIQMNLGHAAAWLGGERTELHLLVMSFPHSNARFCVPPVSEAAECLCAGLRTLFEHVGGAPTELVLDNATEAGRRMWEQAPLATE